jgi:hypothetical protein
MANSNPGDAAGTESAEVSNRELARKRLQERRDITEADVDAEVRRARR